MVGDRVIWIWIGVVVSLLLVELISRQFKAICFAISGIISCILTLFTKNYYIQVAEFLVVGCILITIVKPRLYPIIETKISKITKSNSKKNKNNKNNKNNKSKKKI